MAQLILLTFINLVADGTLVALLRFLTFGNPPALRARAPFDEII